MKNKLKYFFTLTEDQADVLTIHNSILQGLQIKGSPLVILLCAIIIASVGLQVNSTAVVIGAMLISPIMSSILAIGYGCATYNLNIAKKGFVYLLIQMSIAIIASTIFFTISPIKTPSEELIARTTPSFYDVLIALFGGIAGIVGTTRVSKTNVIPGVAIATALMPPLCTIGFGLATQRIYFVQNALYLFAINAFYIILTTFFIVKYMSINNKFNPPKLLQKRLNRIITISALIITIPSFFLAYEIASNDPKFLNASAESFVEENINSKNRLVMETQVDTENKELLIVLYGDPIDDEQINTLEDLLSNYYLDGYSINIINGEN